MSDAQRRKDDAGERVARATGYSFEIPGRGPATLPTGRRVFFIYARGHNRGNGTTYWFGLPNDAVDEDRLVLLLGDADFVLPIRVLTRFARWMTHSSDGRLTPYVVEIDGHFEQRVPGRNAVVPLDHHRDAYVSLR
jgi:hypothetical protein